MPRIIVPNSPITKIESTSAVRAIINIGHHVLLARGYGESFTHVPGGHIDPGETPEQALIRELREEIGRPVVSYVFVTEMDHEFVRSYDGTLEKQHSYIYHVKLLPVINELRQHSKESHLSYEWHAAHELWKANLQPPAMLPVILSVVSL